MGKISIILQYNNKIGYSDDELNMTIRSIISQNYADFEILLVDSGGEDAAYPNIIKHEKLLHLPGKFTNRAQALNAAINKSTGDFVMLVDNIGSQVTFRLSTLEIFLLAVQRNRNIGMVYADYQLINVDGEAKVVHLLYPHPGRVRDNMDYGAILFFPRAVIEKVGGLEEKYRAADLYDLRLKVASEFELHHIAAAKNGHVYSIKSIAKAHNVFDYLIASKDVQLEMEDALTEHLKRIGAYLAPGVNYHPVPDSQETSELIASVIIPVFNRKRFIGTAIESVQAQTVQDVEILVMVNGGEDDPTIDGLKAYLPGGKKYAPDKPRVRLFVEDINNIGFCFNKGLREARGKYYVQLDSDDRLKPDAIEKLLKVYQSDPRIAMVIGSYEVWKKDKSTGRLSRMEEIPIVTHDEWTEENGRNNLLRINGAGAPRSAHIKVIQQLGGFGMNDEPYSSNYGEDYDLVLRISEQYRIGRVWEAIYEVVRHAGGTDHAIDQHTIDRNDNAKDYMRLKAIKRRQRINR